MVNVQGSRPTEHAVRNAVKRMRASGKAKVPRSNYHNCGRKPLQRLLRGMPHRLAKCKLNRYGPCGK